MLSVISSSSQDAKLKIDKTIIDVKMVRAQIFISVFMRSIIARKKTDDDNNLDLW